MDRRFQVAQILEYLESVRHSLVVVLGDFNDWLPGRSVVHVLDHRLGRPPRPASFPVFWPNRRVGSRVGESEPRPASRLRAPDAGRATRLGPLPHRGGNRRERRGTESGFFFIEIRGSLGNVKSVDFPLYTKSGDPTWLVSSEDSVADVALIPLPEVVFEGTKVTVFAEKDTTSNMRLVPMSVVTLVGYPHGYFDTKNFLPIWKTGSIASEPAYDFDGRRLFVVDVSAFPGMSGSPVMAIANGTYAAKDGGTVVGSARQSLGVFASRDFDVVAYEKRILKNLP